MVNFGLEHLADTIKGGSEVFSLLILLYMLFFGERLVGKVAFTLGDRNLLAHIWTKFALESFQIDKAVSICVKHLLHENVQVFLGRLHLVLAQVLLKIFV